MHRFFIPPGAVRGSTITIDQPEELHHIRHVLRLGVGEQLICFDGTGTDYVGTMTHSTSKRLTIRMDRRIAQASAPVSLWLAQGLPKADRFECIVQKATELGVARISPLMTRHTVVRLTAEQGRVKQARWQRIAQEAAKQCRRATVPVIDAPQPLEVWLQELPPTGLIPPPVACREAAPSALGRGVAFSDAPGGGMILIPTVAMTAIALQEVLKGQEAAREVVVLIGPEGDFSREEVALAERYGARPVSLGPLILRTETAAIATLAILSYVFGR